MAVNLSLGGAQREALRTEALSLETQAEQQRKALVHLRNSEDQSLRKANEEYRQQVSKEAVAGRKTLDEMREVRKAVHSKLRLAKAAHVNETAAASHALARAGQRALTARTENENWQAQAARTESAAQAMKQREQETYAIVQDSTNGRVAQAKDLANDRLQKSSLLTQHAQEQSAKVTQHAIKPLDAKEQQFHRHAQIQVGAAQRGADLAKADMYVEQAKAGRYNMGLVRDLQRNAEAGAARVSQAQRELEAEQEESQQVLSREDTCSNQVRRLGVELKDQAKVDFVLGKERLEIMLQQVATHANSKKLPFEHEQEVMKVRAEAVNHTANKIVLAARQRTGAEEKVVQERLNRAKAQLADLQAQCAAHVSELLSRWEAAKRDYAARVAEVERRTEELLRQCQEKRNERDQHCASSLEKNDRLAKERHAVVERQAREASELVQKRADAMRQQASEKRRQADARLVQMQRHVEEVEARSRERVQAGAAIAEEKVQLSRERHAAMVQLGQQRAEEAILSRDKAQAAYDAVIKRCLGAADEARCRGLSDIAEMIMPQELEVKGHINWEDDIVLPQALPHPPPNTRHGSPEVFDDISRPTTANVTMKETASTFFPDRGGTPQTISFEGQSE